MSRTSEGCPGDGTPPTCTQTPAPCFHRQISRSKSHMTMRQVVVLATTAAADSMTALATHGEDTLKLSQNSRHGDVVGTTPNQNCVTSVRKHRSSSSRRKARAQETHRLL